jgi:hypothetical protein
MLDRAAVTTLLSEYKERIVLECPATDFQLLSARGTSFTICNWFKSILVRDADICLLRIGNCYCHAAILCDDWLIDIAHTSWAYNLRTSDVVCLFGEVDIRTDSQHPLHPISIRWYVPQDMSAAYEIGSFVFDNLSCSESLHLEAALIASRPCRSVQPYMLRFVGHDLHILLGDCYTQIEDRNILHYQLDAQGKQHVLSQIFNQEL